MTLDSYRLSRVASVVLVVGGVSAAVAGCASATALSPSSGSSVNASVVPSSGGSPAPSPLPSVPTSYNTVSATRAGGSSIQVQAPCDLGTVTVRAYPQGAGVGMTATLRNTAHARWGYATGITPESDPESAPSLTTGIAHDGVLVIHGTNLTGPNSVKKFSHSWPQAAGLYLNSTKDLDCGTRVFLSARQVQAQTPQLQVHILRSGTLSVDDGTPPAKGMWHVTVTAHSPNGSQRQARSVATKAKGYITSIPYELATKFTGLTKLRNFTSVTVRASHGQHRLWVTLTRTP